MTETRTNRGRVGVALAWLLIALPLGWGLLHSVRNALPLFNPPPASPAAPR
jgi:hypothetical protein